MKHRHWKISFAALSTLLLAASFAVAQDIDSLAERLIALRGRVENLQDQVETKQNDHRNRMNALAQRRASLQNEIQNKELQLRQLRQAIAEQREKNRKTNASSAAITPTVKKVSTILKKYVDRSIPFKSEERLKSIDDLLQRVNAGDLTAPKGLSRIWSLYEDEFRLTRENKLFRQEVVIDGKAQLADVIRLGTMMMFYRTSDERTGHAKRVGDTWIYMPARGGENEAILELFSNFERQVTQGFFKVPNALVGGGQ